jgi:hypothetical protein
MKKLLIFITLQFLVLLPAFADWFPALPMSVFWTIKDIKWVDIPAGSVITFYDWQNNLISTYTTEKSGQYGGNTAFEKAISLNQFEGWLKIKILTWGNTYTITSSEIDDANSWTSCPAKSSIIFFSWVCRYNLNVNTWGSSTWWAVTYTWSTTFSTWTISNWGSLSLSGSNITVKSLEWDYLNLSWISGIIVSWLAWNWILIPPTSVANWSTENATSWELAGLFSQNTTNTILQTIKVGWESWVSLLANWSNFRVSFTVSGANPGTTLKLFRSVDWNTWEVNSPDSTCTLDSNRLCTFYTNHLSYFTTVLSTTNTNTWGGSTWWSSGGGWGGWSTISNTISQNNVSSTISKKNTVSTTTNSNNTIKKEVVASKKIFQITWKMVALSKDDKYKKLATMLSKWDEVELINVIEWDIILVKVTKSSKQSKIWLEWYMKLSKDLKVVTSNSKSLETTSIKKTYKVIWKLVALSKDDKYKKLSTMLSKWDEVELINVIEWDVVLVKVIKSSKQTKIWLEWYIKLSNDSLIIKK